MMPKPSMAMSHFLKIAIQVAAELARLHRQNVIHQNIRPKNIHVDAATGEPQLLGAEGDAARAPDGTTQEQRLTIDVLQYASPEQTGRTSRPIDQRSDLYSLGVTLYQLLSGTLPFQAGDALGWVHCHIAVPPRPLGEVAPDTPRVVSDIVMKLLSKAPEDRYQSARGLERDLARCLAELEAHGRIAPFPIAEHDVSDELRFPTRLYGRDHEIATLFAAFEQVLATGAPGLALVSGYSGIGKTSLVQELYRPIVRARGFFLEGKFDQYKRGIPYFTMGQAFRDLVRQVLSESEERLEALRLQLRRALGPNGRLVADVIPQIELILGELPPVPPLPTTEAQNRFNTVFQSFIGVFAKKEHPLVLFLDDLQWLDFGSLNLLQHVLTHPETEYLFVLGAYRNNEVSPSHPLVSATAELRKANLRVIELTLEPLPREHLTEFVADTLHSSLEDAAPLSELLTTKTEGNPFFVTQFLLELHHECLVRFDADEGVFRWDLAAIEAKAYTDNIVELIVGKLRRLPAGAQDALKLAACIGNEFEIDVLAAILDETPARAQVALAPAFSEGVVLRRGGTCKFLHDRVQHAAYTMIPEQQRGEVHLRVGRLLWEHTGEEEIEERLFDLVNQFNLGAALSTDVAERRRIAALNLRAGRKAKASVAHKSAAAYLSAGLAMLGEDAWESDYALAQALHLELAECQMLNGSFEETARLCALLHAHARTKVDKAAIYRLEMQAHTTRAENEKGIEVGIECLKLFDIELVLHPGRDRVQAALDEIDARMHGRQIEDLLAAPLVTEPETVVMMAALADIYLSSAFWTDPILIELLICRIVQSSIEHGNTGASTIGYALFGAYLKVPRGEYRDAYRFGKLAFDLIEKHDFAAYKAQVCNVIDCMILHWSRPLGEVIDVARIGVLAGIQTGNTPYKCLNSIQRMVAVLLRGDPLDEVRDEAAGCIDFLVEGSFTFLLGAAIGVQRLVYNMQGVTESFSTFTSGDFDAVAYEEDLRRANIPIPAFYYYTAKVQARFIAGDHAEAAAAAAVARDLEPHCAQHMITPEFWFFSALAAVMRLADAPDGERGELRALLVGYEEKLRVLSASCQENYLGKHRLVCAEMARVEGRDQEAAKLYDDAIRAFRASGLVQNEGVANELAGRFYEQRGFLTIPEAYIAAAKACFSRWGAHGKVRQLNWQYPGIAAPESPRPRAPDDPGTPAEQLDTATAVKASRALSHETVPERLLASLMHIVIEHAGAQRCCLLLPREGAMDIIAEAVVGPRGLDVRLAAQGQVLSFSNLPASIVNYVRRTREKLLLDDASRQGTFTVDEYIARERPKSVLCLPIVRHGSLEGVLYLENRLVAGAFTPRRLALLDFLAVVSLENATLYNELALENAGRKEAEKTLLESEERLRRLIESANLVPWEANVSTGRFTYVGPQAAKVLGYPEEEWKTQNALEFLGSHLHPEDKGEALARFFDPSGYEEQFDFRVLTARGATLWLHNVVSVPRDEDGHTALSGFMVDITDRKEIESTLREQLDTIRQQQDAIRTLSTPIIEVWEGVLTMPVLGTIDQRRAEQMMDVLLSAIVRTGSRFAIIDLTGVEAVDTSTADHILKLVRAVQLLGSRGIVVGIRPEVAQTMISIGVDLSSIITLGNLREALLLCMGRVKTAGDAASRARRMK